MKYSFSVLCSLSVLSVSAVAEPVGFIASESAFQINNADQARSVYEKWMISNGERFTASESNVQFFSSDAETQILAGSKSSVTMVQDDQYLLHSGSMVISSPKFTISTATGPVITADNEQTLTSLNLFGENEISVQAVQGLVTISDSSGNVITQVAEEQSIVLTRTAGSPWSLAPEQTGAPSIFPFLAQVDDEGGSAVEEDEEDRRRFFLLTPLLIGGAAVAATVTTVVVVDEVTDDDNKDDEEEFVSAINNESTVFTGQ